MREVEVRAPSFPGEEGSVPLFHACAVPVVVPHIHGKRLDVSFRVLFSPLRWKACYACCVLCMERRKMQSELVLGNKVGLVSMQHVPV